MTTPAIALPQQTPSPSKTPTTTTPANPLCYDLSSPQNLAAVSSLLNAANLKDSRWLTLEVCRQFQRNACTREEHECKFAHPPPHVDIQYGRVTCCYDSIKGKCQRKDPPCKYLHPPQHLKEQLVQNGRKNLIVKSVQLHLLQQQFMNGNSPALATTGYPFLGASSSSLLELPGVNILENQQSSLNLATRSNQEQISMLNSLTTTDPNQSMNPFSYLSAYPANGGSSNEIFSQFFSSSDSSAFHPMPAKRPALVRERSNIPSSKESSNVDSLGEAFQQQQHNMNLISAPVNQQPLAAWKLSPPQQGYSQPPPPHAMMNLLDLNFLTAINLVPASTC